jgi:hypothetical protein
MYNSEYCRVAMSDAPGSSASALRGASARARVSVRRVILLVHAVCSAGMFHSYYYTTLFLLQSFYNMYSIEATQLIVSTSHSIMPNTLIIRTHNSLHHLLCVNCIANAYVGNAVRRV